MRGPGSSGVLVSAGSPSLLGVLSAQKRRWRGAFSGRGRDTGRPAPPAQIRTCATCRIRLLPRIYGGKAFPPFRTPARSCDTPCPLCVGDVCTSPMFSLVRALSSTTSAAPACFSVTLFGDFIGVGSEVARLRAGHRPPLKLYVRFSRIQLSRRLILPRCK